MAETEEAEIMWNSGHFVKLGAYKTTASYQVLLIVQIAFLQHSLLRTRLLAMSLFSSMFTVCTHIFFQM